MPGVGAALSDDSRVLFGTDYPHMNEAVIASSRQAISEYGRLDLTAVRRDNTLALFPQQGAGR